MCPELNIEAKYARGIDIRLFGIPYFETGFQITFHSRGIGSMMASPSVALAAWEFALM
jgi:hypothetical protein